MHRTPPIFFYNPSWAPGAEADGDGGHRWRAGNWVWTVKTARILASLGTPCTVVDEMPAAGIVFAHRNQLPDTLQPGPERLLACLVADATRHPFAQVHVFQNPADPALARPSAIWPSAYVPHWPESDLVPRDPARGDAFVNVSYFGLEDRLAPELRRDAWRAHLQRLGLAWRIVPRDRWHDYADTDAVVAVRRFDRRPRHQFPASKLYNAWIAGVPAILGAESAYRAARTSPLDFVEVGTPADVARALQALQRDPELRRAMAAHGRRRAAEVAIPVIARRWQELLARVAIPSYERWRAAGAAARRAFLRRRAFAYRCYQLREAAQRLPNAGARAAAGLARLYAPEP